MFFRFITFLSLFELNSIGNGRFLIIKDSGVCILVSSPPRTLGRRLAVALAVPYSNK